MAQAPAGGTGTLRREWWFLGGPQEKPVRADQWLQYDPPVQFHLSAQVDAMRMEGNEDGLVLDMGPFTEPPLPYQIWCSRAGVECLNNNEPAHVGQGMRAGFPKELWELGPDQLPASARHGIVVKGFYQIHGGHIQHLQSLERYLQDGSSRPITHFVTLEGPIRRRVVLLIEFERPNFMFGNMNRFRKIKVAESGAASARDVATSGEAGEHDNVPAGEAVFQWWWGDPYTGWGHWKNYHHHVSDRLEREYSSNQQLRNCQDVIALDGARYMLQKISAEKPFDYLDDNLTQNFREPFLPAHIVRVDHPLFDEQTRLLGNTFVQFQKGNPKRRRPVRRVRKGEAAGYKIATDEPCGICFSDDGVLTGCDKNHLVCKGCMRTGLRLIVGDVTQQENLLCGCMSIRDTVAFEALARMCDAGLQELIATPPEDEGYRREFESELAQVQRAFALGPGRIPIDIFQSKVKEWEENVRKRTLEPLYHACSTPGCGMDNWILKTDFDNKYRKRGLYNWVCKRAHQNCVLPLQAEIDDMNKSILAHPEYYIDRCGYDQMQLRRFRLCEPCVGEGQLTFAVHESGCKQWPGGGPGHGHRHCFCFSCMRVWGGGENQCSHSCRCTDPGIQQVRRSTDPGGREVLELGYISGQNYIKWMNNVSLFGRGRDVACPPTVWKSGHQTPGLTRQSQLNMEDKEALKEEMRQGTS